MFLSLLQWPSRGWWLWSLPRIPLQAAADLWASPQLANRPNSPPQQHPARSTHIKNAYICSCQYVIDQLLISQHAPLSTSQAYATFVSLRNQCVKCIWNVKTLDIAKQAAYLVGMGLAWGIYQAFELYGSLATAEEQVGALYQVLVVVEIAVIYALIKSFPTEGKRVSV